MASANSSLISSIIACPFSQACSLASPFLRSSSFAFLSSSSSIFSARLPSSSSVLIPFPFPLVLFSPFHAAYSAPGSASQLLRSLPYKLPRLSLPSSFSFLADPHSCNLLSLSLYSSSFCRTPPSYSLASMLLSSLPRALLPPCPMPILSGLAHSLSPSLPWLPLLRGMPLYSHCSSCSPPLVDDPACLLCPSYSTLASLPLSTL